MLRSGLILLALLSACAQAMPPAYPEPVLPTPVVSAEAEQAVPPELLRHYCTGWVIRELVLTTEDCRTPVMGDGNPRYLEGIVWRTCGERKVEAIDQSVQPPKVICSTGEAGRDETGWIDLGSDSDGIYALEADSVRRVGSSVDATLKTTVPPENQSALGSAIAEMEIDCTAQTSAFLSARTFDRSGHQLLSKVSAPNELSRERIFQGSVEARVYEKLCPSGKPLESLPPIVPTRSQMRRH